MVKETIVATAPSADIRTGRRLFRMHKSNNIKKGIFRGSDDLDVYMTSMYGQAPTKEQGLEEDDFFAVGCLSDIEREDVNVLYDHGFVVSELVVAEWGEFGDDVNIIEYVFKFEDVISSKELNWCDVISNCKK